jgi:hypothetical protein
LKQSLTASGILDPEPDSIDVGKKEPGIFRQSTNALPVVVLSQQVLQKVQKIRDQNRKKRLTRTVRLDSKEPATYGVSKAQTHKEGYKSIRGGQQDIHQT